MTDMFSCKDISEHATDQMEGALSFRERLSWRLHLLLCQDCRRFIRQFTLMVSSLRLKPDSRLTDDDIDREASNLQKMLSQRDA